MSALTPAERESLMNACPVQITPDIDDHVDLFAAVESIITARVEAFRAAAVAAIRDGRDGYLDSPDLSRAWIAGWRSATPAAARIVANLPAPQDAS